MPQREIQKSHQIQCLEHEQQQWQLTQHLCDIEAEQIRAANPCRSIRLHFHFNQRIRYFIFGEERYINQHDLWEGEFPACGWRVDHSHFLRCQNHDKQVDSDTGHQGAEGNQASKQGAEWQDNPKNSNAPTDKETDRSISIEALWGNIVQGDTKHANEDAEGTRRATCISPSMCSTDSTLTHDIV
jgi:hypothetical protein